MEVVNTLDIDGTQWEIQDAEARNKIATLEDMLTTKDLQDLAVEKNANYNWDSFMLYNHYSFGKIHFVYIRLTNISGTNIGSVYSAQIATLNIKPMKETSFIIFDYINGKTMRCFLKKDGIFTIGESNGVTSGNNDCYGELIFAEA